MPNTRKPRSGSMQFWPRVRAKREYARVRTWPSAKDAKPLGFAGYKVGMTHVIVTDNLPNSITKGKDLAVPVTVIECPPLKIASIRFYKNSDSASSVVGEVFADNLDKDLSKKSATLGNKKKVEDIKEFDDIVITAYTQPKLTGIGKKKPELFELGIGGSKDDKLAYAKENLGKEIALADVIAEGQQLDIHAVTKGKGFQGPMKRFGIARRNHKSEKSIRNPGSLGGWVGQQQIAYRVARGGKMGYHTRTEYNKQVIKVGDKPEEIMVAGDYVRYGVVKNSYLLVKGGIAGPSKRLIRFSPALRENKKIPKEAPAIVHISKESKQGN